MLSMEAIDQLKALAAARGPLLVATDLDGTLAPIVPVAADARVPAGTLAALDRLATTARVAVITGRDLNTARRMVPCEGVVIIGSHGLEHSFEHPLLPGVDRVALNLALEHIEQRVISAVPSLYLHVERKAISTAFHFRQTPDLEMALRAALESLPPELRLREGRMVLEVLPNADGGKDRAFAALLQHFKARSAILLGDDDTDVGMFRAGHEARDRGLHVLIAGVSGGAETPPEIASLSDIFLRSTDEALEALETLARALGV